MHLFTAIIAILAITVLDIFAISRGLDGTIALTAIGAIAGLGGYVINQNCKK